ncbi:MAG: hypothetical protein P8N76_14440 [Pirellulaceae bacterium]|nr:hypothetical protein [Pirellulaceae bacterium]
MPDNEAAFSHLEQVFAESGSSAALDRLVETLQEQSKYHELFEALKMKLRHQLGLPLRYNDSGEELEETTRQGLEDGLIDACRQVGVLLLQEGKLREGWMYLRPVGESQIVLDELAKLEPHAENIDEFIELCLHEGLDLPRGFQLMLDHYGTCNSITTFESSMYGQPRDQRKTGASLLVSHVYNELVENVRGHIEREEKQTPPQGTLGELIADRSWLFADGGYHVDTTHLSSVVRFARDLDEHRLLWMARELTTYGNQLDQQLQYASEAPFAEFYPAHQRYFDALLGQEIEEAILYFRQQAEKSDAYQESTVAIEVYLDLLARLEKWPTAIEETVRLLPESVQTTGLAPSLLDLSEACQNYDHLRQACRERDDLLGYTIGLLNAKSKSN